MALKSRSGRPPAVTAASAEAMALEALAFLAADEGRLGGFLGASGLSPADLPLAASDAAFLGGVLDFLLQDEALLEAFCAASDTNPEAPLRARALLPGATPW